MTKKQLQAPATDSKMIERRILAAYYVTLAAFFVASFFPQARLWGINWWAYWPLWTRIAVLAIVGLVPLVLQRWFVKSKFSTKDISDRAYWLISASLIAGFGLLFYLLRARTHFLGDGYTLISILSSDQPFIKPRNAGGMGLQLLLVNLLGGRTEAHALLSYQITSIGAGLLFLGVIIVAARKLLESNLTRILMVLSLATGGYMLLFFGYVENYALFVVTVLTFGIVGLLVTREKLNRWWILLPQAVALFFHIFGAVLLPASAYLFISNTHASQYLNRMKRSLQWVIVSVVLVLSGFIFSYYYSNSYFFRFSFVPIVSDRYTIGSYTMFSLDHLLDFASLVMMLAPGILVSLSTGPLEFRKLMHDRGMRFLIICSICSLSTAFLFDPKLGMPRDWDLFAFCGVPLLLAVTWGLTIAEIHRPRASLAVALTVMLAILLLFSRAQNQANPSASLSTVTQFVQLDGAKTGPARYIIMEYLRKQGDRASMSNLEQRWQKDFIPDAMSLEAGELIDSGKLDQAYPLVLSILRQRPNSWESWGRLGWFHYTKQQYDSALICMRVADGLNPYNRDIMYNQGLVYFALKDLPKAESSFRDAHNIDTLEPSSLIAIALVRKEMGDTVSYLEIMHRLNARQSVPTEYRLSLIRFLAERSQFDEATKALKIAVDNGLDRTWIDSVLNQFPQMKSQAPDLR